jgi:hypothetical protein
MKISSLLASVVLQTNEIEVGRFFHCVFSLFIVSCKEVVKKTQIL